MRKRRKRSVQLSVICQAARYTKRHNYMIIIPASLLYWVVLKSSAFKIRDEFPHAKHHPSFIYVFTLFSPQPTASSFHLLCSLPISFHLLVTFPQFPRSTANSLTIDLCVILTNFTRDISIYCYIRWLLISFGVDLKESSSVVIQLTTFIGLNLYVPCTKPTPRQQQALCDEP